MLKRGSILLLWLVEAIAAAQGSWPPKLLQQNVWAAFHRQLKLTCKSQHLEWLTYGDLNLQIETYTSKLSKRKQAQIESATNRSCNGVDLGVSCANTGFLYVLQKDGSLPRFVKDLCQSRISCNKSFECTE